MPKRKKKVVKKSEQEASDEQKTVETLKETIGSVVPSTDVGATEASARMVVAGVSAVALQKFKDELQKIYDDRPRFVGREWNHMHKWYTRIEELLK